MASESADSNMPLSEKEISECKNVFSQFDKDGTGRIDRFELRVVLEQMGQKPSEEEVFAMWNEVDDMNTGKIDFNEFLRIYERHLMSKKDEDEQDMIDAFVAMGGNPDKSGQVDAERLINIIRHQFEMTINIEQLIQEIDENRNGQIDYDEFKSLLSS